MQELVIFLTAFAGGAALGLAVLRYAGPELLGRLASASTPPVPGTTSTATSTAAKMQLSAPAPLPDPPQTVAAPEPVPAARAASVETTPPPEPAPDVVPAPQEVENPAPEERSRRQHKRLVSDEPILVTPFGGSETMAEVCDVSLGGVRFRVVGVALRADDMVRLTFNLGGESLSAVARVLRTEPLDDITTEVAAVFARLDPWASRRFEAALAKEA